MIVNFINTLALKTFDIATKYEVFSSFKMIVNFINTLALKTFDIATKYEVFICFK